MHTVTYRTWAPCTFFLRKDLKKVRKWERHEWNSEWKRVPWNSSQVRLKLDESLKFVSSWTSFTDKGKLKRGSRMPSSERNAEWTIRLVRDHRIYRVHTYTSTSWNTYSRWTCAVKQVNFPHIHLECGPGNQAWTWICLRRSRCAWRLGCGWGTCQW